MMTKNISELFSITAEYYPTIPREEIVGHCKYRLSLNTVKNLGGSFLIAGTAIGEAVANTASSEGLYRCVFPDGVTGHLARFKEDEAFLGTIVNQNGIAGQARWIPAENSSVLLSINPVTIAIAAVMLDINKKLDVIKETQTEIMQFMVNDKEADLEGAVNSLSDIHENFKYNSDNERWIGSKLTIVSSIKNKAEHNIIFFRKQIKDALDKQKIIHGSKGADKLNDDLKHNFKYYQIGLYLFSYASFMEIILGENYNKEFLNHISEKIKDYSDQYRIDYTECYDALECYAKGTVQKKILGGIEAASKAAGEAIARIPGIREGQADETLIAVGEKLSEIREKQVNDTMESFRDSRETGVQIFRENIDTINSLCNEPVEIFFDNKEIYISDIYAAGL